MAEEEEQKEPTAEDFSDELAELKSTDRERSDWRTNRKYDWEAVETAYVHGIEQEGHDLPWMPTHKDLANYFQVPLSQLQNRSSKHRWGVKRKRAQVEKMQKAYNDRIRKNTSNLIEFDNNSYNFAKLGMAMATARMGEIAQDLADSKERRESAKAQLEAGLPVEPHELWSAVDARELQTLASAAEQFQAIGRKALNADVIRHEISGPDGGAIETEHKFDVSEELRRPDSNRLSDLLTAMKETNLMEKILMPSADIEDAEVVDDDEAEEELEEQDMDDWQDD